MHDDIDDDQQDMGKKHNPNLMFAAASGNLALAEISVSKGANVKSEEEKWTALSCASAHNHPEIVRFLIQHGAAFQYRREPGKAAPVVQLGVIKEGVNMTPLHWACQKGNWRVICILLKENLCWDDLTSVGNNAIHLAASSNDQRSVEILLEWGVDITLKNSRGHLPIDLSTNPNIVALFKKYMKTEVCPKTGKKFKLNEIKYMCHTCRDFFCAEAKESFWTYVDLEDKYGELPMTLCKDCFSTTKKVQAKLNEVIELQDEEKLREYLKHIINNPELPVTLDVRVVADGQRELERLRTQNEIKAFIKSLEVIDNYKTIVKSQDTLNFLLKDADNRRVNVEQSVIEAVLREQSRLTAERDLRKFMDHLDLTKCDSKTDAELGNLIQEAMRLRVSSVYTDAAQVIKDKMAKTLDANRILEEFLQYEPRSFEYPLYPEWNRAKQKWFTPPPESKVFDIKKPWLLNPNATKKEKKKWDIKQPLWYKNRDSIIERIGTLNKYLAADELKFDEAFRTKAKAEIIRMGKENRLLKQLEDDKKTIEDAKPKKK